jgi:hypothetical protein
MTIKSNYIIGIDDFYSESEKESFGAVCIMKNTDIIKISCYRTKWDRIKIYLLIKYYKLFYNASIIKESNRQFLPWNLKLIKEIKNYDTGKK